LIDYYPLPDRSTLKIIIKVHIIIYPLMICFSFPLFFFQAKLIKKVRIQRKKQSYQEIKKTIIYSCVRNNEYLAFHSLRGVSHSHLDSMSGIAITIILRELCCSCWGEWISDKSILRSLLCDFHPHSVDVRESRCADLSDDTISEYLQYVQSCTISFSLHNKRVELPFDSHVHQSNTTIEFTIF